MSNFNTKRFIQTLKWSAMATKKEIATIAGCMFFLYMVPFIMSVISTQGEPDIVADASIENATLVCTFFFGVYTMISGCWIMNNMKTKEQRITFKMLPASDLEKFIVRVLYITVVWMLIGVVAFCLADFCRMLICFISGSHGTYSTIPDVLNMWFGPADTHSMRMTAWGAELYCRRSGRQCMGVLGSLVLRSGRSLLPSPPVYTYLMRSLRARHTVADNNILYSFVSQGRFEVREHHCLCLYGRRHNGRSAKLVADLQAVQALASYQQ